MWLTGFDAPCLHTMYADKPMQGHDLMRAIARQEEYHRKRTFQEEYPELPNRCGVDCDERYLW